MRSGLFVPVRVSPAFVPSTTAARATPPTTSVVSAIIVANNIMVRLIKRPPLFSGAGLLSHKGSREAPHRRSVARLPLSIRGPKALRPRLAAGLPLSSGTDAPASRRHVVVGGVASPDLGGGQVAVLRLHAAPVGHATNAAYSCLRAVYVLQGTKCVRAPRKRRTSEKPQRRSSQNSYSTHFVNKLRQA